MSILCTVYIKAEIHKVIFYGRPALDEHIQYDAWLQFCYSVDIRQVVLHDIL